MSNKLGKKKLQAKQPVLGQVIRTMPKEVVIRGVKVPTTPPKQEGVMITLDQAISSGQVPHNSLISMKNGRGTRRDYSNVYVRLLVAAHLIRNVLNRDEATDEIVAAVQDGSRAMQEILEANKRLPPDQCNWNASAEQYIEIEAALDVMDQLQRQMSRKELCDAAKGVIDSLNRMSGNQLKAKADELVDKVFNEEDGPDPHLKDLTDGDFTVQAFPKY